MACKSILCILMILLLLDGYSSVRVVKFSLSDGMVAEKGRNISMLCDFENTSGEKAQTLNILKGKNKVADCIIYVGGSLPCSKVSDVSPRYTFTNNQPSVIVSITDLQISDAGNWYCGFQTTENTLYTLNVYFSVSKVNLSPQLDSITENIETSFTCETSPSRPAANIIWYKESIDGHNQMITSNVSFSTEDVDDLEKSTSKLKYTPERTDNGSKIYCKASNIPGKNVKSSKFTMDVQFRPDSPPKILLSDSSYKVIENTQGLLSCEIKGGNPLATLVWSCFDNGHSSATSGTTVTRTVQWKAARGSDRSCICQSFHPVAGSQSVSVNVSVLYKPDSPKFKVNSSIVSGPISFINGKSRSVVCESNGKPKPDIYSWYEAGESTVTGNTLTLNPVQRQDDSQYTCKANNTMVPSRGDPQIGSSSSTVKIDVLYAPEILELDDKDMISGSKLSYPCPVTMGNPSVTTFKWTRDGDSREWDSQTLEIDNITKDDDMMYTCTVQNTMRPTGSVQEIGTDSKSFHLIVNYMASVTSFTVEDSQKPSSSSVTVDEKASVPPLICTVDSYPGSRIEIQFLDKILHKEENAKTLTYNHAKASCLDTGVYTCSAMNQFNLGKASERKFNLFVRCSPRPLVPVKENVTSALRAQTVFYFKGLAYPTPNFIWMRKDGNKWRTLSNSSNISISVFGVDTNLTINNVSQLDFGEYQLKIDNGVDDDFIQHFYLIPDGVPETPTKLQAVEEQIKETSVLLQWKPGFDGGPKQTFILMYKKTSDHIWMNKTVEDTPDTLLNYTLNNLVSSSEYQVVVFSRNRVGPSPGSTNITFMTRGTEVKSTNGNSALIGAAAGGSVGVALFVVLIAGFVFLRRRGIFTRGKAYDKEGKSDRAPVHADEDDYGMQDNPMYVSAGPRDKAAEGSGFSDAGAVYSTVDKGKNRRGVNKNDVFAEVDKSKKTKTNKGKDKEKNTSGFPKGKKNTKMAQEGDIYENATTTELQDTVAKQKKNDEIIYENPETSKPAATKNVNKDGLIYADLTFNDRPKGQKKLIIHGLDSTTEYIEVDFTKIADPLPDSDDENIPPK